MHFLTNLLVSILTLYIAGTNYLALGVQSFIDSFTNEPATTLVDNSVPADSGLSFLPGITQVIPDILLRSGAYQQAALASVPGLSGGTTKDPLEALVNIFCTFRTDEYIRTTTGTGFFIDPDGVIMTNAHVAQFFLLENTTINGDTDCTVRTGNPAAPQYKAELLYLPPAWIQANAKVMNDAVPMGTGERDYALLYVSSDVYNRPLPAQFPSLAFNTSLLPVSTKNTPVTAAGYPAGNLIKNGPSADLNPQQASTTVSELYTFGSNYADVFSIRGSSVGAEGSSGGPVLNRAGEVIGIIVTRGNDATDGTGSLRAITLSHIERTMTEETGFTLEENISGNLPYRATIFAQTLTPFLVTLLGFADETN